MNTIAKLTRARIQIQKQYPFFAYLSLFLKFQEKETPEIADTICVNPRGEIYYNDKWIDDLDEEEMKGVLTHEVLHLTLLHMTRRGSRNPKLWNCAIDLCANYVLVENNFKLPKGLVPDKKGNFTFKELCNYTINVKGKTSEEVYDELEGVIGRQSGNKGQGQQGQGQKGQGGSGENDGENEERDCGDGIERGWDKHLSDLIKDGIKKEFGELSESERAELERLWLQRIQEAYVSSKLRGNMPLGIELFVGNLHESRVNWKNKLLRQIQKVIPYDFTYAHPSKKSISTGIYMPDTDKERIEVSIMIDTSGSVGQEELSDFISEIIGIAKAYKNRIEMKLYCHDTKLQASYKVENGSIEKIKKLEIRGGGGTSFITPLNELLKEREKPKLLIWLTDGCGDDIEKKPAFPILWILSKGGSDELIKSYGEVIHLK